MMNKKAAIYARVSSKKQKDEETIESQVSALSNFAKKKGFRVPDDWIFLDNGVSGSTLQRLGLDELRDHIRSEPICAVLVYAPDRLSRSYPQQLVLLEEFKRNGVDVHFIKSPPECNTPEGIMFQHFQGIFAEYERALILDRSRRGRIFKAKQGDPSIIPKFPYGYRKVKDHKRTIVEVVEQEAVIVRDIYRMYVYEQLSVSKISQTLTENGIRSPSGLDRWDYATLRDILKNHAYTGSSYFGKTEMCEGVPNRIVHYKSGKRSKAKNARKLKPESEWIPISIPAIISESDFEQAQEQLKKNAALASRNTRVPTLLQGLIICGQCGYPYYKRTKKSERTYYHCRSRAYKHIENCENKSVTQEKLDDLVFREVVELLKNPEIIEQEIKRRAKDASNTLELEKQEKEIKSELSKIKKERDRLLDAYQGGLLGLTELSDRNKKMDERRNNLENKLQGVHALKFEKESSFDIKEAFKYICSDYEKGINELSFEEKRRLVLLLVEKVVVNMGTITLHFNVSPKMIAREKVQLKSDCHGNL